MVARRTPQIPLPRPVLWPLRPPQSADVAVLDRGSQRIVTIEHALLESVTVEMLTWWYGHIPGTMPYAGAEYPRYLVWHPLDHISYDVDRVPGVTSVTAGAGLHIVEAFGRDPNQILDVDVKVITFEQNAVSIAKRLFGSTVLRLDNEFEPARSGARYVSRLTLGDSTIAGRMLVNRIARNYAMPDAKLTRWIKHHIEEIGNLPNFLPTLFRERSDVEP